MQIEPAFGIAGVYGAKTTGSGAGRTHQHDRSSTVIPAFTDIRAVGFFTNRGESMFGDCFFDRAIAFATADGNAQPWRLALDIGLSISASLNPIFYGLKALRG